MLPKITVKTHIISLNQDVRWYNDVENKALLSRLIDKINNDQDEVVILINVKRKANDLKALEDYVNTLSA